MRLLVARALDPVFRRDLASTTGFETLPFIRGRTVVPKDLPPGDLVVAGHPNFLGVFDEPGTPWIAVTGRWSSLRPIEGALAEIALEPAVEPAVAGASLAAIRDLAKRAALLRGVTVAFPPVSPVLVVLLSVDPVAVVDDMGLSGCTPLEEYDELPGGLRIAPDPLAPGESLDEYAAALEMALEAHDREVSSRWT